MCAALCNIPLAGDRVRVDAAAFHPASVLQNGGFPVGSSRGRGGARQKPRDLCPLVPTQRGPWGIRYDFNCGCRVQLPKGGTFHVTITDMETGTVFADGEYAGGDRIYTTKKYFVPYIIDVRNNQTGETWQHVMQLKGKPVAVHILVSTIGDVMAWFPYVEKFQQAHGCEMHVCFADGKYKPLFRRQYPQLHLTTTAEASRLGAYASYMLGLWWGKGAEDYQPFDHRLVGLAQTAGHILGVDPAPVPPRLDLRAPRRIAEPYVCVAAQSSTMSKNWQHPGGWRDLVYTLKRCGYRVLCIDREREEREGEYVMRMPEGAEDWTGNKPLQERIDVLKDADFFVGMASGLAWLAWGCGIPVVMIGGFSHPLTEFPGAYRVVNPHFCNSCWNDTRFDFDHHDWMWCPRHQGTPRQHECMKQITPEQVMRTIMRIPSFQKHMEEQHGRKTEEGA